MKLIDKIKNIKVNSKIVIGVIILIIIGVIGYGINYCFYSPSSINKYIASNLYETPANNAFVDDNFYQCVVDEYNSNYWNNRVSYSTSLSDSQLKTITNLSCSSDGITSAEGVEKLTSLKYLDLDRNQLTSLDVSENTALESLSVESNQLISLDLNGAFKLKELYAEDNKLSELVVNENPALKKLYLGDSGSNLSREGNLLEYLDVSKNTELEELDVSNNKLESLNVSENTKLQKLVVARNKLKTLEIGQNQTLTTLKVHGNLLEHLDISGATALEILYLGETLYNYTTISGNLLEYLDVKENKRLQELDVSNNLLTSLDVSENTKLTKLNVANNKLTTLDVSKNVALKYLSVYVNQLSNLDVSSNTDLIYLYVGNKNFAWYDANGNSVKNENFLTELDLSNNLKLQVLDVSNNQLTSLDVSGATSLTHLYAIVNQLTSLDVSGATALTHLYARNNQLTSLDVSGATALTHLYAAYNQLISMNVSGLTSLTELEVYYNQLTSLDVSKNTKLKKLDARYNQLTSLDVSGATALTELDASNNQLKYLDVSKNTVLVTLDVMKNQLTSLDVSNNTLLTKLYVNGNQFNDNLIPVFVGENVNVNNQKKIVKLPNHLVPTITTKLSVGLEARNEGVFATKVGKQSYVIINNFGYYDCNYDETYYIEVVDIKSDKYNIDKTKDYIIVGSDDNDTILSNITVENGNASIEEDYLVVKNGEDEVKRFKLIRLSSGVYDLSKDYIYVGTTIDEDIINNIETNAEISISDNNILNIKYGDNYNENYTLIRLNASYDISKGYIYTWDSNYLDNINVINGSKEIIDNNLIVKYNDIELDKIPILNLYSDIYIIKEDYIYTGLSNIDLSKITTTNNLELSTNDNKVILTYKDNIIDEIPYYYLKSNSNDIRFSSINNKIYVKNTMMTYRELLQYIVFNFGGQSVVIFDKNDNRITNDNLLIEEGSYLTLYENKDIKHIIEVNTEYVEYKVEANVHYTDNYGIDIIKNLNNNNTFINVKDLIETDGNLSIFDKEDNMLEDTSNIKTGDKVIVTFPSSNKYYIYLSVKGDVTGKGIISNDDVLESYSILRGSRVEDYYRFASDINEDGKTKINDVAKLYQYVNKKIESLE